MRDSGRGTTTFGDVVVKEGDVGHKNPNGFSSAFAKLYLS